MNLNLFDNIFNSLELIKFQSTLSFELLFLLFPQLTFQFDSKFFATTIHGLSDS